MLTFWPSIPNWDENFSIKMPSSKGPISPASSVWRASPATVLSTSPFSAELTLCEVHGDAGAVKKPEAQLAASLWICCLDS